jgi:hypothetical protein
MCCDGEFCAHKIMPQVHGSRRQHDKPVVSPDALAAPPPPGMIAAMVPPPSKKRKSVCERHAAAPSPPAKD